MRHWLSLFVFGLLGIYVFVSQAELSHESFLLSSRAPGEPGTNTLVSTELDVLFTPQCLQVHNKMLTP